MATNSAFCNDNVARPVTPNSTGRDVLATSTPLTGYHGNRNTPAGDFASNANVSPLHLDTDSEAQSDLSISSMVILEGASDREVLEPGHIAVPILGYEVMEERARFSVFKIQVRQGTDDIFYIFRRYSDFYELNNKLKVLFPHFRLALPPKKWFGDNFDKNFLEDRMIGLQAFLNNLVGNKEVCNSEPVREFFCFDDPPGPHDSLEESRALCESLEEQVFCLHQQVADRDIRLQLLEDELRLSQIQVENLRKALKTECMLYSGTLSKSQRLHADHVINLVLLDLLERSGRKSLASSLPPMKEAAEQQDIEEHLENCPKVKVTPATGSEGTCSIELESSLNAIETLRMTTVAMEPEPVPASSATNDAPPDVVPRQKKYSGASPSQSSSNNQASSGYSSDSKSSNESLLQKNHQDTGPTADGATDLTGPGKAGSQLHVLTDSANTSSSPRLKHRSLESQNELETSSPGAHSVDSSSRKRNSDTSNVNRGKTAHSATTSEKNIDTNQNSVQSMPV